MSNGEVLSRAPLCPDGDRGSGADVVVVYTTQEGSRCDRPGTASGSLETSNAISNISVTHVPGEDMLDVGEGSLSRGLCVPRSTSHCVRVPSVSGGGGSHVDDDLDPVLTMVLGRKVRARPHQKNCFTRTPVVNYLSPLRENRRRERVVNRSRRVGDVEDSTCVRVLR